MARTRPYFFIASRMAGETEWFSQFGDFSRQVVADELRDMKDSQRHLPKFQREEYKLVCAADSSRKACAEALLRLNGM